MLAVRDLHEEIRAGLGSASFRMRMLDHVSLNVHAGEFVVVRGDRASGAHALRAVLEGTRAVRSGVRLVGDGVGVRHATVSWDAVRVMMEAWNAPRMVYASAPRWVFVLRVRHTDPRETPGAFRAARVSPVMHRWSAWAMSLRACQGSVVAHVPWTESLDPTDHAPHTPYAATRPSPMVHGGTMQEGTVHAGTVHERAVGDDRSYGACYGSGVATVRTITLAGGRIVSAVPVSRPTLTGQRGADAWPIARDPDATAWTRQTTYDP